MKRIVVLIFLISLISAVKAQQLTDTSKVALIIFEQPEFDAGNVLEGDTVIHKYYFSNTGSAPLRIERITSSCSCITWSFDESKEIAPGERSYITVSFLSTGRKGAQRKNIIILSNAKNKQSVVLLTLNVISR